MDKHEIFEAVAKLFKEKGLYKTSVFLIETKALGDEYRKQYIKKRDRFESHIRQVIREGIKGGASGVGM